MCDRQRQRQAGKLLLRMEQLSPKGLVDDTDSVETDPAGFVGVAPHRLPHRVWSRATSRRSDETDWRSGCT
jgi:hypothetical protein